MGGNMVKLKKDEKGFSLLEVLVAMIVLSLVILSFSGLFSGGYKAISDGGNKSEALFSAQQFMEYAILNGDDYSQVTVTTGNLLQFNFPGTDPFDISGNIIIVTEDYHGGNKPISLTTFVPKNN